VTPAVGMATGRRAGKYSVIAPGLSRNQAGSGAHCLRAPSGGRHRLANV
jgi:hypothetical protein